MEHFIRMSEIYSVMNLPYEITPVSEPEFELAGDRVIVFLQEALPVLYIIKILSIMSVPKLNFEVLRIFLSRVD